LSTLKNNLHAITADGTACNVMVGIGETYLPAFVLALTGSQLACGLTATVPLLLGAILQLFAPYAIQRLHSYRRWVVLCAVIQALSFVPLIIASLTGSFSVAAIFLVIALYWATGQAGGAAWNAWVEGLVPERVRAKFFACRTRYVQIGLIVGFIGGGIALQIGRFKGFGLMPFALLFIGAAISRLVSAKYLDNQSETKYPLKSNSSKPWSDFFAITTQGGNSRIILYILAAQLCCQISGPYFTPYMLGHLKLSYIGYVTLICVSYFARVATVPTWGRLVKKIGVNRLLWLSGLTIVPLPALWDLSDSFTYLIILQVFSGAVWGAYELANLLLIIESIPAAKKINILTVYNFANALAIVGGSFIGGYLLTVFGGGRHAYLMVFLASTMARAVALLILVKIPLRLPVFGLKKKALPLQPILTPPMSAKRPLLKPLGATSRVHVAHTSVPKPAFLRVSASASSEKDAKSKSGFHPAIRGKTDC
jgi:MFS family permease